MKIRPLADKVVVKRSKSEERTPGGIVLPDGAKEKPRQGEVLAVGPGRRENGETVPVSVETGDVVMFSAYSGHEVKDDVLVLSESEILGVIE